jgi:hypothetical protein
MPLGVDSLKYFLIGVVDSPALGHQRPEFKNVLHHRLVHGHADRH